MKSFWNIFQTYIVLNITGWRCTFIWKQFRIQNTKTWNFSSLIPFAHALLQLLPGTVYSFVVMGSSHCRRFAPTYSLIAQKLHEKNSGKKAAERIYVGKVEGSKERILSSRFSIRGYPTFYVVDGWNVYEYNGIRSLDSLTKFVERDYKKEEVRIWMSVSNSLFVFLLAHKSDVHGIATTFLQLPLRTNWSNESIYNESWNVRSWSIWKSNERKELFISHCYNGYCGCRSRCWYSHHSFIWLAIGLQTKKWLKDS